MNSKKQKILVILGPTATGKSDLAVQLARKFDGEVVSADSRQVYKGLDIGTGKITKEEMQGVPHHLLDVCEPGDRFTVTKWKEKAETAISQMAVGGHLPIVCGGTGFYISALIDDLTFPEIESDPEEQRKLEQKTTEELFAELKELDPERAANIDAKNKRRVARAILIARQLGKVPALNAHSESRFDPLLIGITLPDSELKTRIRTRLIKRLEAGMIDEAKRLHDEGLSFERMNELGLEYKYLAELLQSKISREEFIETLATKIWQYARRQKTWFKKDKRIRWHEAGELTNIEGEIQLFLG
jgi:tRNA dimethylallyltransferase